ncbi:MAG: protein-L-isoaspartate O-methyltransferase [Candidatus Nealsonbacteria bacterium]|nr:protein-L-isoaspartate O-methyltransferase [Candidatus Nealsonbacteria bacterium]
MANLVDSLIKEGWLKTPEIIEAFRKIKRIDFLPKDLKDLAGLNQALPIGFEQTISQPLVVAFMLEKLEPKKGDKILDIGSGSGWTTALLSEIVGKEGKVIAIELVPELAEFGKRNAEKYNFVKAGRASFIYADGSKGYPNITSCPELAEGFDKILCSASVHKKIPSAWKDQLKIGGRIVTPIDSSIWLLIKNPPTGGAKSDKFEEIEFPGFSFVPLIVK